MHRSVLPLLAALAGCANYDFASARLPTGEIDMPKLVADLKASGDKRLCDMVWIPLIYQRVKVFQASEAGLPPGYKLLESSAVGPLFCAASAETRVVDQAGKAIESNDYFWLGWGLVFRDRDEYVETPHGTRLESRWRLCVLLGDDDTTYTQQQPTPGAANAANPGTP